MRWRKEKKENLKNPERENLENSKNLENTKNLENSKNLESLKVIQEKDKSL